MVKQQVMAVVSEHVRLPLWKRLILITALLLSGESLAAVLSSHVPYTYAACNGGPGGPFTSRFFIKPPPESLEPRSCCYSFWEWESSKATVRAGSDPAQDHRLGSTPR